MHAPAQGTASVSRTERHKILVVEDEQDFRETLAALLETHGFDALQAANGAEGIELARQNRPDLIICDIYMSGVNGYGALEALRARTDTATIPFIFLTGDRDPSGLRRGMESGADDYLLKPVAPETLLATIRARLAKLNAQRRHEHETHARLLAVFEATPDLIAVAELEDRHITYINRAGLRMLGVPQADDIASLHLQNLFTPAAWTHLRDAALPATQRDGNWLGESALLALDGHEVPVSLVLLRHPAAAGQGGYYSLIARDITERKLAELELRASFKETEALLAPLSAILIGVDQNGRIARWNHAAEAAFGLNTTQAIGHLFFESGIHWDWEPVRKGIIECLANHRSVELGDVTYKRADGRDGAMHLIATPGSSESAHRLHFILLGLDTTQRHQLEAQLRQVQKLESIGQLAAGIAHEINTPTQFIGDNLRFLQDSFGELKKALDELQKFLALTYGTPEAFDALKHVKDALAAADIGYLGGEFPKAIAQSLEGTERVAKIVRAMKEFSHPDVGGRTPVNLNRAIESTVAVATNEWKYHAEVVTKLDPDLPDVSCFPGDINQVILNLVVNAAHAIAATPAAKSGQKGTITVSTRRDGDTVELRIADTGTGIPEKFRDRVFDPFFTTKEVGKGTGQGLFIVHNVIVEKHGGTIDIETEEGKGTTFVVRLPLNPPKKSDGAQ